MLLGEKVKIAINEAGLTTEDVAYKIDMSSNNLYRLYKKDSFEIKYLIKIAEIVKKPLNYFIDEYPKYANINQSGIGNQAGNNIKQKITGFGIQGTAAGTSEINIEKVLHELQLCKNDNAHLQKQIALKDRLIEILEKNQK